jgi:hypothetical protein
MRRVILPTREKRERKERAKGNVRQTAKYITENAPPVDGMEIGKKKKFVPVVIREENRSIFIICFLFPAALVPHSFPLSGGRRGERFSTSSFRQGKG